MKLENLYCIVGPSGSGKSTLTDQLKKRYGLATVASYTTRSKRLEEVDGDGHVFISQAEFNVMRPKMVARTNFSGADYGVTAEMLDQADLFVVDLEGLDYLVSHYKNRIIISLGLDPGPSACCSRMIKRGDPDDKIRERLEYDATRFADLTAYCNVILDASLSPEHLTKQAWAIIQGYEPTGIPLDRVKMLLQEYIAYDYEGAEPGQVQKTLDELGFTKEDIRALDLGWLYSDGVSCD